MLLKARATSATTFTPCGSGRFVLASQGRILLDLMELKMTLGVIVGKIML